MLPHSLCFRNIAVYVYIFESSNFVVLIFQTVILCSWNENLTNLFEDSLKHALCRLHNVFKSGQCLPGLGITELQCSYQLLDAAGCYFFLLEPLVIGLVAVDLNFIKSFIFFFHLITLWQKFHQI